MAKGVVETIADRDQAVKVLLTSTPLALGVLSNRIVPDQPRELRWIMASESCARFFGVSPQEISGSLFRAQMAELGAGTIVDHLIRHLDEGQKNLRLEFQTEAPQDKRYHALSAYAVDDLVLVHFFEITDYKNQETRLLDINGQLEEAAVTRDQILAAISHEVRTPLNTIVGYLEMIESEVMGPLPHTQYREYISDITEAAHSLNGIVEDLLAQQSFKRLKDVQTGYRQIIDLAPDLMAVVRGDRIEMINPAGARMLEVWPVETLIGRLFKTFLHADDREIAGDNFAQLARGHGRVQVQLLQTQGGLVDAEMAAMPIAEDDPDNEQGPAVMLVARDVTERQRATTLIIQREERLSKIVNGMVDGLIIFDCDGVIETFNPAAQRMFRRDCESVVGGLVGELVSAQTLMDIRAIIDKNSDKRADDIESVENCSLEGRRADGVRFPLEASISRLDIGDRRLFIMSCRDVTERRRVEQRMTFLATRNHVTELPNRTVFSERLDQAIARADESEQELAILFLDIDHFKNINDTMGHMAGDQVLVDAAARLTNAVRRSDFVAHFGGDEFTLLLEPANAEYTAHFASQLLEIMAKPYQIEGREIFMTISLGIVMYPENATDIPSIMRHTDTAAHFAKKQGRNNYQFYTKSLSDEMDRRMEIELHLRRALERDEFTLNYQPKVDIDNGGVVGCEALLRWISPELGFVSPAEFVPVAEDTNLIVPIGDWVLRRACRDAMRWRKAGYPDIRLAVNLSPRQFKLKTLPQTVANILDETGLPPEGLDLEITESMLVENFEATIEMLKALRALGVTLSIDDFGTGYSSLSYLKRFPINTLKIDRQFIKDIPEDKDDEGITRAIISMAKSLELKLVAEGAETAEQIAFLRAHAVEEVQGYIFSKPLPVEEFLEFCQTFNAAA